MHKIFDLPDLQITPNFYTLAEKNMYTTLVVVNYNLQRLKYID